MRDFTLLGFVEHLGALGAEMVVAETEALERAAKIIEKDAKESAGEYQAQAGPFAAWAPLADSTKADRLAKGFPEDEPELRTGELRDSIEHKVVGKEAFIGSNSEVMEWQELGTSRMPARSILGGAAFRKADEVVEEIGEDIMTIFDGVAIGRGPILIR